MMEVRKQLIGDTMLYTPFQSNNNVRCSEKVILTHSPQDINSHDQQSTVLHQSTPTKPIKWHAPWKLYKVIKQHTDWVQSCAVQSGNKYFATGSNDGFIIVWKLSTGQPKLGMKAHCGSVRGLAFSVRHRHLFSCGDDGQVKCWDLSTGQLKRCFLGHTSTVLSLSVHPLHAILVSAGQDSVAKTWDLRTKTNTCNYLGHTSAISSVICPAGRPGVITGSHDTTIKLWHLTAGKLMATLSHHKSSVRAICTHPSLYMFASASADSINEWRCPEGKFLQSLTGHYVVNDLSISGKGVLASGADDGTVFLWDFKSGYNFQQLQVVPERDSISTEADILSVTFDETGTRLITTGADKSIKIYREDYTATEQSNPINNNQFDNYI